MRNHDLWGNAPGNIEDVLLPCAIDPISAAVGGILPALFGGGGKKEEAPAAAAPAPAAPPPQAAPASTPQAKPSKPSTSSSFIGGVPTPPLGTGSKTLLGQ